MRGLAIFAAMAGAGYALYLAVQRQKSKEQAALRMSLPMVKTLVLPPLPVNKQVRR